MIGWDSLADKVAAIVADAAALKDRHTDSGAAHVSYCAVFCHSTAEFAELDAAARSVGVLANDTQTGPVYVVPAVSTTAGPLRIVKIRKPDQTRTERGDADFAVPNYSALKQSALDRDGFKLIERDDFEMIELMEPGSDVRVYFSHPPVEEHAGIKETLAEHS